MSGAPFQLFDALPAPVEDALRSSIERFGVLVPVVRDQHGRTLDGHHRARLADHLGVKYRVDVVRVSDDDETGDQLREHIVFLAAQTDEAGVGKLSANQIAQVAGVDQAHVTRTLNDPELMSGHKLPTHRKGADGKVRPAKRPTVVPAKNEREAERAQTALTDLGNDTKMPPTLDVKRAERIAREQKAEERRQEPVEPTGIAEVDLRHGDFRTCLDDLAGTVDAIITDPPYPAEFVPLFSDLSRTAAKLLKPNGVLVAMVGQSHLPAYIERLSEHLAYRWCGAYMVQGPRNRVHRAKVGAGWKPLLMFQPHGADPAFLLDDTFSSTGDDKDHHVWGQSESGMASIVDRFASPGQVVVDPFLGGGTTAVVCRALGIHFVGCDIDAAAVHSSRDRVA
jgi:ParB-like chromosome segregation protein Spo0J